MRCGLGSLVHISELNGAITFWALKMRLRRSTLKCVPSFQVHISSQDHEFICKLFRVIRFILSKVIWAAKRIANPLARVHNDSLDITEEDMIDPGPNNIRLCLFGPPCAIMVISPNSDFSLVVVVIIALDYAERVVRSFGRALLSLDGSLNTIQTANSCVNVWTFVTCEMTRMKSAEPWVSLKWWTRKCILLRNDQGLTESTWHTCLPVAYLSIGHLWILIYAWWRAEQCRGTWRMSNNVSGLSGSLFWTCRAHSRSSRN